VPSKPAPAAEKALKEERKPAKPKGEDRDQRRKVDMAFGALGLPVPIMRNLRRWVALGVRHAEEAGLDFDRHVAPALRRAAEQRRVPRDPSTLDWRWVIREGHVIREMIELSDKFGPGSPLGVAARKKADPDSSTQLPFLTSGAAESAKTNPSGVDT
jgi:hypothetical protein